MHAYLITGKTREERLDRAKEVLEEYGAAEIINLPTPKSKHFIKDIREINHKLSLKSGEKPRGVIIQDAHLLTTEAANSFLKTLEEPPGDTIIILTAPNQDLVLGTIASRCTNIELGIAPPEASRTYGGNYELGGEEKTKVEGILQKLFGAGVGERLKFAEGIKNREEGIRFCVEQIYATRKLLIQKINGESEAILIREVTELLDRLDQTRRDLESNVNVKLAIGDLLLNYPYTRKTNP